MIHDFDQRSDAWKAIRVGRLGSSNAAEMVATIKSGEAAARRNLRVRLTLERIVGRSLERDFVSQAMQDGMDREADGLALYEAVSGEVVSRVGYIAHDTLLAGFSPDGLIGDTGFVECKSPIPSTHLGYLTTGKVPTDYYQQLVHGFWISGRQWCDWISYQPDFPEPLRLKIVRVERNELEIGDYDAKARTFLGECDREVERVLSLMAVPA